MTIVYCIVLEVVHRVLDPRVEEIRIEGRAGASSSIRITSRSDGQRSPRSAEPCCCRPPESSRPERLKLVLDLVPEHSRLGRAFDQLVHIAAVSVDPGASRHVLVHALGKGIGLLQGHADPPAGKAGSVPAPVMFTPSNRDTSPPPVPGGNQVVHPVEAAEPGVLLPQARGPIKAVICCRLRISILMSLSAGVTPIEHPRKLRAAGTIGSRTAVGAGC